MVSHIRYVHVVNRYMRGRHAYTFIGMIVALLLLLSLVQEYALVMVCMGYVVICPLISLLERVTKRPLWQRAPGPEPRPELKNETKPETKH